MELTATMFYDDLVEKCKQGSSLGFKELYTQYQKAMFNTSLRIVNNAADAEDIVQDGFIDAFRNIDGFNYQSTFGSWIKRIVINKSINHLRKRKIKLIDINQASFWEPGEQELSEDENIAFKVAEIKQAVADLPAGYRTVFTLFAFEGYDYGEISEILNISPSTARTQYHRAKKQLLQFIKRKR